MRRRHTAAPARLLSLRGSLRAVAAAKAGVAPDSLVGNQAVQKLHFVANWSSFRVELSSGWGAVSGLRGQRP